ncbi:LacI family transcriptional regulator [Propioniciclava coleopterorum]|uniref:LacI family transcriptional regulator n=1 Tax=Propioniciclava coleopterorum TaxID=2714937 RepID=A0A6G7Y9B6_9ACTN|nr:LacI family DNA-binding transcriptional regulator [Propioniciclava coleopterorum]QIK73412.1 LacI family transcriptional regulator [Propioniciclava coleopterorum]
MARYPTLKDVALRAGTSAATVSYVLNGAEGRYVSPEMRERVLAAVEAVGYIKSSPASSLHGKRRGVIALLVPQFSNAYFTQLMVAIESVVEREGYLLSICNTFDDPERERDIIVKMAAQRVDGYIVIPTVAAARNTAPIRKLDVPLVLVDRPITGVEDAAPQITPDNFGSGFQLGRHLGEAGHRRAAYLGWVSGFDALDDRRRGFWEGLRAAADSPVDEVSYAGEFSLRAGYDLAARALHEHPDLTALCMGFNVPARGSVNYLAEQGIVPGRDLSVVLIGAPDWAMTGQNDFTLVDLLPEEIGRRAAEELLLELSASNAGRGRTVVEGRLRVGTSVTNLTGSEETRR